MKVTLLILSCLAYFASAQLINIGLTNTGGCTAAGGCSLSSLIGLNVITSIIGSGGLGYSLDLSTLSAGSTVNIDSTGSFSGNSLFIGALSTGNAIVNIASGFTVNAASFVVAGGQTTVNGAVQITNSASSNVSVTVNSGATLVVAAGGSVQAGASQVVANGNAYVTGQISTTSTYTQSSASLVLNSSTSTTNQVVAIVASSISIETGATLSGNGVIGGSSAGASAGVSVNISGSLSIGNSPGVVTINGDWRPSGTSIFNFEAASSTSYDQLYVTGKAYVNGVCKCTLLNNYGPGDDTRFPFINAAGGTDGSFTITTGTGNNALKWSTSVTSNQVIANYNSAVSVAISGLVLVACVLASML